jgi:two-component sensor histidine kinase
MAAILSLFYTGQSSTPGPTEIISTLLYCTAGLGLTHGFRAIVIRYSWFSMPPAKLIISVFFTNLAMGLVLVGFIILWGLLSGLKLSETATWLDFISALFNTALIFLIWSLIYFLVYSFRNYKAEEIERLKSERFAKESELARLKSQLNPHFMFNALNSIRALVAENPGKAQQSITQLSHLLRTFLMTDRLKTVPLSQELKTTVAYLELEKLRYEERLSYEVFTDDQAQHLQVPTMMIQTLVENAIKHGISKDVKGGALQVKAHLRGARLIIEVINTGRLGQDLSLSGYGLANTRQRLALLYGDEADFDISNEGDDCVNAHVSIPLMNSNTLILHEGSDS